MNCIETPACIELQGQRVAYTLRQNPRAHRVRLRIHPDGRFVVTVPVRMRHAYIGPLLVQKSAWIIEHIRATQDSLQEKLPSFSKTERAAHVERARVFILERLHVFCASQAFSYRRVCIRDQHTRWGSCSSKGNLNFNYKLIFLPGPLADYIIAHELCHLKELNHSVRFWASVEQLIPDYRERRAELKRIGGRYLA